MMRLPGRALAASVLLGLLAAGCGNTTSDEQTTPADSSGSSATAPAGGEATRDQFVARPGVPGVTDDEIAYTVVGTKTGNPLGTCILDCYVDGIEAYFAYRNAEGGIYGRELVINEVVDDELALNQAKAQEIVAGDDAFGSFQATLLATGWGVLDDAGVPTYAWGIHASEAANRPHVFPSVAVRCPDCTRPAVPYVAQQSGATRAASLGYGVSENSKVCTNAVADAIERFQDETGVELVYTNDQLEYGLPNGIGPVVTAMKDAGVDFISTCIDLNGMKTLGEELKRQGMQDVVLYHPNSYDHTFVRESGDLFEGDVVAVQFRPFEASADGNALAAYLEWMEKEGNEPSELSMVGWINASMAYDALLAAGPEFDRQKVVDALNAETAYTAGGLLSPINWTKAHVPYTNADRDPTDIECGAFVRIEGGEFVPLSAPDKPWFCWPEGADTQFEPEQTNFT